MTKKEEGNRSSDEDVAKLKKRLNALEEERRLAEIEELKKELKVVEEGKRELGINGTVSNRHGGRGKNRLETLEKYQKINGIAIVILAVLLFFFGFGLLITAVVVLILAINWFVLKSKIDEEKLREKVEKLRIEKRGKAI